MAAPKDDTHKDSNLVVFQVELQGGRRTHELKFQLGETIQEKYGCIKVKTAVDGDSNDINVWIVMKKSMEGHADAEDIRRWLNNEIGVLKLLDHRHVLKLFQVFASDDRTYVLTERSNTTLAQFVEQSGGRLNPHLACTLFNQLLSAVGYVHSKGLAHRNICPDTVLLDDTNSSIRLAEFEHACLQSSRELLTTSPGPSVNAAYAAPELKAGEQYHGKKADAFSVVSVLCYMLTGNAPPEGCGKLAVEDPNLPLPVHDLVLNTLTPNWKRVDGAGRFGIDEIKQDGWVCSGRRHSSTGDVKPQALDAATLHHASFHASGVGFNRGSSEPLTHAEAAAAATAAAATGGGRSGGLSGLSLGGAPSGPPLSVAIGGVEDTPPEGEYEGMSSPDSLCDDSFSPLPRRGPRVFGEGLIPEKVCATTTFPSHHRRQVALSFTTYHPTPQHHPSPRYTHAGGSAQRGRLPTRPRAT